MGGSFAEYNRIAISLGWQQKEIRVAIKLIQPVSLLAIVLVEVRDNRQTLLGDRLRWRASADRKFCLDASGS
jgi:hypothetical protein